MSALPALSRAVDRATGVAGLIVLVVAVVLPHALPPWPAWLAVPLVWLASRRPLLLPTASSEALVVGLDSSVLVLLGLLLPVHPALLVWAVSITIAELTARRSWDTRVFNAGVCVVAGALALPALTVVPSGSRTAPVGLLAVVLAATIYFVADYLWSALSIAVAEQVPWRRMLELHGLPLAFLCFVGVDSLGVLAAIIVRVQPWAAALLAVPFLALLLASHSWSEMRTAERRGAVLSRAAVALQGVNSYTELEQLVVEYAPQLVRAPWARWQEPGQPAEGVLLPFAAGGHSRELQVGPRVSGQAVSEPDLQALRMLLGVAQQAAERLHLLAELGRSAAHDALTGLANRSVLGAALAAAVRDPAAVAVLYCDLDGFKQLNDTYGHATGDALLVAMSGRLRRALRPDDLAVRLGGDEFAVLLRGLSTLDPVGEAEQVAGRLCAALAAPYDLSGLCVRVPASVGVCVRTGQEQPEDLLRGSDAAMYQAKASGGGRTHTFPAPPRPPEDAAQLTDDQHDPAARPGTQTAPPDAPSPRTPDHARTVNRLGAIPAIETA